MKEKLKLIVILGVEFAAIAIMLVLIFMAGKQQYTVTFDLNGGVLIGGSLSQSISQGGNATPPTTVKEGHYLRGWSGSYKGVTHDTTVYAIWEYETTPGIQYKNYTTYSLITNCFEDLTGDVYVGAYHDDLIVLGIGEEAFKDCRRIENIFMLDGILTIGKSAFENCHSLDNVVLPSTTLTLGDMAFKNCESLTSVTLPHDLERIGEAAFEGCVKLPEIDLPRGLETIGNGAFRGCTELSSITLPTGLTEIGAEAFAGCTELTEVYIPTSVQVIGEGAFLGCEKLEKIVFFEPEDEEDDTDDLVTDGEEPLAPEAPEEEIEEEEPVTLVIGARAFMGCVTLTDAILPDTLTELGAEAFRDCSLLESVTLPVGLVTIGDYAFAGCAALTEVVLPEGLNTVGEGVFDTPEMTVKLPFSQDEDLPEGWSESFCSAEVTLEYTAASAAGGAQDNGTDVTE